MLQSDSIKTKNHAGAEQVLTLDGQNTSAPADVLSEQTAGTASSQQDSIAAQNKYKEYRSAQADTTEFIEFMGGKSVYDVTLPKNSLDSLYKYNSYFQTEEGGDRTGIAGDPIPYTIAGDSIMTSLLIGCFIITALSISVARSFFGNLLKSFFFGGNTNRSDLTETSFEVRLQILLALEGCLLFSIVYCFYLKTYITDTFTIDQFQMICLFTGVFAGYFLLKAGLYTVVNWVFFDRKKNLQWQKASIFLQAGESLLIFPAVLLLGYFSLSVKTTSVYILVVVIIIKLLALYKQHQIFFQQKGQLLEFFSYFCTLEIVPLTLLWSTLTVIGSFLEINF